MKRNKINPKDVGRLEVGTETFLDKSKSIKTYLMDFFKDINFDIEGVTTSNACYGGTNALINAINWMHSDFYDGRYAIVISADIAVYAKRKARPTGGCGAVAMLLGPNAPIAIEQVRSTYMNNVYDFYKLNPSSEYPVVDGIFSPDCYFKALESCYEVYLDKHKKFNNNLNLNDFDYFCFHTPFSKMVEKAFYQLVSYDMCFNKDNISNENNHLKNNNYYEHEDKNKDESIKKLMEIFYDRQRNFKLDGKLQNEIKNAFNHVYKDKVDSSLMLATHLGNIYTGSLYGGLLSLLINDKNELMNKRIFMFSYGSGCAASIYTLKVIPNDYKNIRQTNSDVITNLKNRIKISPSEYEKLLLRNSEKQV
jgi:hydroxymethylglutaryl-CoA synthase